MAKSAPRQNKLDTANFVPSIFIIGFLCVGFIPNWEAVDKIAPQWLYLTILNLCCGIYFFLNRKIYKERIIKVLRSWMSISGVFEVSNDVNLIMNKTIDIYNDQISYEKDTLMKT